jgi:hypothetical protein
VAKFVAVCGSNLSISRTLPITREVDAAFAGCAANVPTASDAASAAIANFFLFTDSPFKTGAALAPHENFFHLLLQYVKIMLPLTA